MAVGIVPIFLKNAVAAYSLRRLTPKYTGFAIRIRRSSDNSEIDIGFTSNGELDTTAISNFVTGSNNAFVSLWYDQSGMGTDQSRTILSQQPQIVSSGTLITDNSKPALYFNGSMSMRSVISVRLTSPLGEWSSFGVIRNLDFNMTRVSFSSEWPHDPIGQFLRVRTDGRAGAVGFRVESPINFSDIGPTVNTNQSILNSIRGTNIIEIFANGVSNGFSTVPAGTPRTGVFPLDVGYRDGQDPFSAGGFNPVGYIQELIHYNVDVSCYYDKILKIINSYYKVY